MNAIIAIVVYTILCLLVGMWLGIKAERESNEDLEEDGKP